MDKEKESSSASKDRIVPVNPTPFIKSLIGKQIVVKLKWGMEYCGLLSCADAYMNLQLREAEEFVDGSSHGNMPKLVIRCNNILYIKEKDSPKTEKDDD